MLGAGHRSPQLRRPHKDAEMRQVWRLPRYAILLFVPLVAARGNARAEGFFDLFGGVAMNRPADVSVSETTASGTTSAAASIELSYSAEFGGRFGAWYPAHNWIGLGMDLGYFQADGPGVDIDAFPLSFLLAFRAPLYATPDRPGGKLQPYAMAGVMFYAIDLRRGIRHDQLDGGSHHERQGGHIREYRSHPDRNLVPVRGKNMNANCSQPSRHERNQR